MKEKSVFSVITLLGVSFYLSWAFCNGVFGAQAASEGEIMKENSVNGWGAFLDILEKRGFDYGEWEVAPDVQKTLIADLKARIDAGVVDGETLLPPDLVWHEYVWRLPKSVRGALTTYAAEVLATEPDNGAAAKFLAIVRASFSYDPPHDEFWELSEKVAALLPNDVEICYLMFENASFDRLEEKGVIALERLFERHRGDEKPTLYQWLFRCCYDHFYVSGRPNEFYQQLESDNPFLDRWTAVLGKIQTVFEKRLEDKPEDWHTVRMLVEIHEALGDTSAVEKVLKTAQRVFEKRLDQDENNRDAFHSLARIHEKLGNTERAHYYRLKEDPSLAWVGQILPDFVSAVDLNGIPISLADYRGKVVLIDFWAVWCGPCVGEIPNIRAVYEKYHDKGFDVIGISLDEDETVLREFIAEKAIPWRNIFDGSGFRGGFAERYGVRSIPAPFLLDREGKVLSVKARGRLLRELVASEIEGE